MVIERTLANRILELIEHKRHLSLTMVDIAEMLYGENAYPQLVQKPIENHMHMFALYTVWYNFVKQHKSIKGLSPAMAAGVSKTLWSVADLAEMIDVTLAKLGRRGPYKKAEISN